MLSNSCCFTLAAIEVADPRGEQRLRPAEVVRYSDVDEEPRANQAINAAIKEAGKNFFFQRDRSASHQTAHNLLSKQINAGVDQPRTCSVTFFEEPGDAALLIERHTSIATNISDCVQYDHQICICRPEELQDWTKAPLHIAVAVQNKNRVA